MLGHRGRRHHGHVIGLKQLIALVRHAGRHAAVVVARHHQHAAVRRRAIGVAVLERVARPIHPRALAVPQGKHGVAGLLRVALHALRAQHLGGGQFLVDGGHKFKARLFPLGAGLPDLLIHHAQRRAAVAADKAARVQPGRLIAPALHEGQAHQRLRARHEHLTVTRPQVVGQAVVGAAQCARISRRSGGGSWGGGGHGDVSSPARSMRADQAPM